jgi:hypothetical protein
VEGGANEQDHSGFPMHSKWYFDPSKPCTELETNRDHVDKSQDQNDGNSTDLHRDSSVS